MMGMSDSEIAAKLREYNATKADVSYWLSGSSRRYIPGEDTLRSIYGSDDGEEKYKALIKRGDRNE